MTDTGTVNLKISKKMIIILLVSPNNITATSIYAIIDYIIIFVVILIIYLNVTKEG